MSWLRGLGEEIELDSCGPSQLLRYKVAEWNEQSSDSKLGAVRTLATLIARNISDRAARYRIR